MKIDPESIERRSFYLIESEVEKPIPFDPGQWKIVRRMIHASADFELLSLVQFHPNAVSAGIDALRGGCYIITDTKMALAGINKEMAKRLGVKLRCFISKREVKRIAEKKKITRSFAAVDFSIPYSRESIYVIGNAPTALIRLLQLIEEGVCRPYMIVGMPVGFVNVIESKELLMEQKGIPYITVKGRKGGSTLAVAVVNQLLDMAIA